VIFLTFKVKTGQGTLVSVTTPHVDTAARHSPGRPILSCMSGYTQVKNHSNVKFVGRHLHRKDRWRIT